MRRHVLTVILIIAALLILVPVGVLMRGLLQSPWHSAPDEERAWARTAWDKIHSPATQTPPPVDLEHSDPVVVPDDGGDESQFKLQWQDIPKPDFEPTPTVHLADVTRTLSAPLNAGGTQEIRFAAYSLVLPDPVRGRDGSISWEDAGHFDPATGQLLDKAAANKRLPPQKRRWRARTHKEQFPSIAFEMPTTGVADPRWLELTLFDTRTKRKLNSGKSWYTTSKGFQGQTNLESWHAAPTTVVVDFVHGPFEEKEIPLEIGAVADFGKFQLKIVGAYPGEIRGWGSGGEHVSFNMETSEPDEKTGELKMNYFMLCSPQWYAQTCAFTVITNDGEEVNASVSSSSQMPFSAQADLKPDSGVTLRISHRPHYRRAIFNLPTLGGLPPENEAAGNLFDVTIPGTEARSESDMRELIESATHFQMNTFSGTVSFPGGYFPTEFHDVTAADLLREYKAHLTLPANLDVDETTHTIATGSGLTWWTRVERSLEPILKHFR